MNIDKQIVIKGKTFNVKLDGSGSISTLYGKMNPEHLTQEVKKSKCTEFFQKLIHQIVLKSMKEYIQKEK